MLAGWGAVGIQALPAACAFEAGVAAAAEVKAAGVLAAGARVGGGMGAGVKGGGERAAGGMGGEVLAVGAKVGVAKGAAVLVAVARVAAAMGGAGRGLAAGERGGAAAALAAGAAAGMGAGATHLGCCADGCWPLPPPCLWLGPQPGQTVSTDRPGSLSGTGGGGEPQCPNKQTGAASRRLPPSPR